MFDPTSNPGTPHNEHEQLKFRNPQLISATQDEIPVSNPMVVQTHRIRYWETHSQLFPLQLRMVDNNVIARIHAAPDVGPVVRCGASEK